MQISREEVYISNKFPHVFLYVKSHNFPPNGQISREGASQIPHFFQPWKPLSNMQYQCQCALSNIRYYGNITN